jgi:hypothetical protein
MTTDPAALTAKIEALEAAMATASATLTQARADLAAVEGFGDSGKPARETVKEAIAEARRRGGGRTRSEIEAERGSSGGVAAESGTPHEDVRGIRAADGRAEAVRRYGRPS